MCTYASAYQHVGWTHTHEIQVSPYQNIDASCNSKALLKVYHSIRLNVCFSNLYHMNLLYFLQYIHN